MRAGDIRDAARGRWATILRSLAPQLTDAVDQSPRHVHCPLPGHDDASPSFRFSSIDDGRAICTCGTYDGFGLVGQLCGWDFAETLRQIAGCLGIDDTATAPRASILARVAAAKRCPAESLTAFGATEARRGDADVVRVPMYDGQGQQCSHFDLTPDAKGWCAKGKPSGLFLPGQPPKPSETWYLVEGAKDAAALHGLGCRSAGMPTDHLAQKFVRLFRGVDVIVIPDRTTTAEEKARTTAARLHGVASRVRIVTLPLPIDGSKGDDARDVLRLADGKDLLRQSIRDAVEWSPDGEAEPIRSTTIKEATTARIADVRSGATPLLSTGLPGLDDAIGGGIDWGEFIVIGARPSHGKSAVGLQMCHHVGTLGIASLFLSLEMSIPALADRALSFASPVRKHEWASYADALESDIDRHHRDRAEMYVSDGCRAIGQVIQTIREHVADRAVRLAVVDYCQLVAAQGRDARAQVSATSVALRTLATELGIVIVGLAQLNRDVEKNARPPRISDLKESGQLEQDADVVLFLQHMHRFDPAKYDDGEYRIFVAKNRNREIRRAVIDCRFVGDRQMVVPAGATAESVAQEERF